MAISATSGVVSNIDYQSLIAQLVDLRRQPIAQLESQKSVLKSAQTAYSSLSNKIKDLVTAAEALRTPSAFNVFKTSTNDGTLFTSSAGPTAASGSFEVTVNTLAKAHRIAADGVAAETTAIAPGAGSFSFQAGSGEIQTVAVDSATTLAGLRDSINALAAGVTASIANDGSGANPYRLILTGANTGTANAINITQNDTALAFSATLQAAQDASVTVDGLTYTRSGNNISDMLPGVTLNLTAADALKTVTLTVSRDTESIDKKVKALVDAYNAVVGHVKANNRHDTETKKSGPFFGDGVARSVWEDLRRVVTSAVSGLPDGMNRLMYAGIKTGSDGLLTFDSSVLASALSADFDGVVNLFAKGDTVSGFGELVHQTASGINDIVDGRIKGRQSGIDKNIKRIEEEIRRKEDQLLSYEDQLRAQFTGLETMLATLQNQGAALMNFFNGGR